MRQLLVLIGLVSVACSGPSDIGNCSTFLLKSADAIWVGHNLDESPDLFIPGLVCVNPRRQYREGLTWGELAASPDEYARRVEVPFESRPEPRIRWTSTYGSITFNSEGVDFPDGGMNEKGLSVFEMSMGGTRFPGDPSTPVLFICLWIQYQLDSFATVEEVVKHVNDVNPDGWSWHYFVADRSGDFAIVEFINGKAVIHRGQNAPLPVLCNSSYEKELKRLAENTGIGSVLRSIFGRQPRFIRAAGMLSDFDSEEHPDTRDFAEDLLNEIKIRGWNKWQILVDPVNLRARYRTEKNRDFRFIDLGTVDLSESAPTMIMEIHGKGEGDVARQLVPYSRTRNLALTNERADRLFRERLTGLMENGVSAEIYAQRFADYSERIRRPEINRQ